MSVSIRNLNIVINGMPIVHDVDMDIADGERVGLIGSSGSGKSMIAKSIMGLLPLSAQVSGSIDMGGTEIVGASDQAIADLRGRYVGMVVQNPSAALNPVMTVAQQVALPLRLHYDLTRDERLDRVKAMFAKVRLPEDVLNKYPHELSGGQQQRVGIAAALVTSPRLIIADEPTTALDSITQRQIVDLLASLVDDSGASMLFITHDFAVLNHATTRCYVLADGRVAESGQTADILQSPHTKVASQLVTSARALSADRCRNQIRRTVVTGENEKTTMLQGRGINKYYGAKQQRRQVLHDVDIDVRSGECLAVIGGSGSGKTTLTRVLLGLEHAETGEITYFGKPVQGEVAGELRRSCGLVFQSPFGSLDPRWRVGRSVAEPLRLHHPDWSQERIAERVSEAFRMVSLDPAAYENRFPVDLSGGQAQRVAIARAIADHPKVLLADEPMSAVDVAARTQILASFAAIRSGEPDMALIMVSHDLGVVRHIADRIMVLHDGCVEECGLTETVLHHPTSDYTKRLLDAASL